MTTTHDDEDDHNDNENDGDGGNGHVVDYRFRRRLFFQTRIPDSAETANSNKWLSNLHPSSSAPGYVVTCKSPSVAVLLRLFIPVLRLAARMTPASFHWHILFGWASATIESTQRLLLT